MTNLRILFALNYYHPYISGLSEYVRIIAEALVERGCSVTVLAGRHEANLPPNEVRNGVQIVRAKVLLKLHKGYLSSNLIRTFRRLAREADVVHLSAPMLEAGLLARLTPAGTPLVLTHHCDVIAQRRGSLLEALAVAAVKASARATFQRADRVLVNSKDYASSSVEVRGILQKCLEVPPPDSAPESPLPPRAPGNRVGFLGRWVAEKGIGVLLAAIPAVLRHIPDARFILAGNYASVAGGSEYNRLKPELDRLRDSVETPGSLPDEKQIGRASCRERVCVPV